MLILFCRAAWGVGDKVAMLCHAACKEQQAARHRSAPFLFSWKVSALGMTNIFDVGHPKC